MGFRSIFFVFSVFFSVLFVFVASVCAGRVAGCEAASLHPAPHSVYSPACGCATMLASSKYKVSLEICVQSFEPLCAQSLLVLVLFVGMLFVVIHLALWVVVVLQRLKSVSLVLVYTSASCVSRYLSSFPPSLLLALSSLFFAFYRRAHHSALLPSWPISPPPSHHELPLVTSHLAPQQQQH